jgi:hypothetical protein
MTRRLLARLVLTPALALSVALAAAPACSPDGGTGTGSLDEAASKACAEVKEITLARTTGRITPSDLRARVASAYEHASASSNPLVRARAVALYADATVLASGGQSPSLDSDLAAMAALCSGA